MLKYIKDLLTINKDNELYHKNSLFLDSLKESDMEVLFNMLIKNNENIIIIYNKDYKKNSILNDFYNDFFSKYKKIKLDKKEYLWIESGFIDKVDSHIHLNNSVLIGKENSNFIYIKQKSLNNGVYVSEIDDDNNIEEEDSLYKNIYHYLNNAIGSYYKIDLKKEYIK